MHTASLYLKRARKTLIGDRAFYKMVLAIAIPIIIQNSITNFVSLLDNIMVGTTGTDQMAGVSIANQLLFVSNLCVFGGMSGAGIFGAQFFGAKNIDGVRYCFRYKIYLSILITVVATFLFAAFGSPLISLYLNDSDAAGRVASTLEYGLKYLHVMCWGIAPFTFTQAYASSLRETGETKLPMRAALVAVFTNLVLNYLLIFGRFGFPEMGVCGAALATVISRYLELAIIIAGTHLNPEKNTFIVGAFSSPRVPVKLAKQITVKGMPLLVNEMLWSMGVAVLMQCYSMRGLNVVAAMNISNTAANLFNVVFHTMGNVTAIIVGQVLGAGDTMRAKDYAWKMTFFSLFCSLITAVMLCAAAPFIPMIYNTEMEIRHLATSLLLICALCMPIFSFVNSWYFILRSGGKTMITFLFDCGFSWTVSIPLAFCLVRFTGMDIVWLYMTVQLADLIKWMFGFYLVKKGVWINNIVSNS